MSKPIVPWPGGKRRLLPHLLPMLGEVDHTCYVEAFAGGAALLVLLLLLAKRIRSKRGPKGGKPEKEKASRKEKKGGKAAADASAPADELDTPISETDVP